MGAIAHLYRGEVYRSTIWRTRLDNTTNWAIVTMGIALSTTFSSPEASPLPLLLVGLLIAVFSAWRRDVTATSMSGAPEPDGWR